MNNSTFNFSCESFVKNFSRTRFLSALLFIACATSVSAGFSIHKANTELTTVELADVKKVLEIQLNKSFTDSKARNYIYDSDFYRIRENDELQAFIQVKRKYTYLRDLKNSRMKNYVELYLLWFKNGIENPNFITQFLGKTIKTIKDGYYANDDFYIIMTLDPSPYMMDLKLFYYLFYMGLKKGQFFTIGNVKCDEFVNNYESMNEVSKAVSASESAHSNGFVMMGTFETMDLDFFVDQENIYKTRDILKEKLLGAIEMEHSHDVCETGKHRGLLVVTDNTIDTNN